MDVVLSGYLPPPSFSHSSSFLVELAKILKPSGTLILREPVTTQGEGREGRKEGVREKGDGWQMVKEEG